MKSLNTAAAAAIASLFSSTAFANTGVQLPLSQYQAGAEETTSSLITNPGFEQVGAGNVPVGWTPDSTVMNAGPPDPANLSIPPAVIGASSARAFQTGGIDPFNNYKMTQAVTLQPNTDYVLSAYVWSYGVNGPAPHNDLNAGDLAVLELADPGNPINTAGFILEPTALDGGPGSRGYFVYKTFNSSQFAASAGLVNIEVEFDPNEVLAFGQNRPERSAQFDNIAITPLRQFAAQKFSNPAGGPWGLASNWVNGPADAKGAVASFKAANAVTANVTMGGVNRTVAVINFDAAGSYSINGPGTLTLDHDEFRDEVILNNFQGNNAIRVPITVNSGTMGAGAGTLQPRALRINVAQPAGVLTLSQPITTGTIGTLGASIVDVTKIGPGRLQTMPIRARSLTVQQGTVQVLPNAAITGNVSTLTLAGGTTPTVRLEMTNSRLVVDYGASDPSPLPTIKAQILTALGSGSFTGNGIAPGLDNPRFAIGYAEATQLTAVPADFGTVDGTAVLLRGTLKGDSNLTGTVDIDDFAILAANFNQAGEWADGDSNYSGTIDIDDFGLLASNFNQSSVIAGSLARPAAVPEPAVAGVVVPLAGALSRRHRRGRADLA